MSVEGKLHVVVLAAGKGTRMRSTKPKVLHTLAGQPMLAHVLNTAKQLMPASLNVVVGFKADEVRAAFADLSINWITQSEQLGTGHAVKCAVDQLHADANDKVLVLLGDVPLIDVSSLRNLIEQSQHSPVALLTSRAENPDGYGRIVRDQAGEVVAIVEQKDADAATLAIKEVNTGIMLLAFAHLKDWLAQLRPQNAQGELYLTDVIAMARDEGLPIVAEVADAHWRTVGVNDLTALSDCEQQYQLQQARALQRQGVQVVDPWRFTVRGLLAAEPDVFIDVGCIFEGEVVLESGAQIGPYCYLRNCVVGSQTQVAAYSHLDGARIGSKAIVGPYARLRPGSRLSAGCKVGNFVEIKNASLASGAKVNHLSYVGDAVVGQGSNLGAGTITCNYDGANKHRTSIGENVFVGSAVQLVAPVSVGDGATIAAGSTITEDVAAGSLSLARSRQVEKRGWKRPDKQND